MGQPFWSACLSQEKSAAPNHMDRDCHPSRANSLQQSLDVFAQGNAVSQGAGEFQRGRDGAARVDGAERVFCAAVRDAKAQGRRFSGNEATDGHRGSTGRLNRR